MTMRRLIRWSLLTVGVAVVGYLALLSMVTERGAADFVEAVMLAALTGGAVIAAIRFAFGRPERRPVVTDPFARDVFSTDTVNISHVRVAGVGGAGLVIAAIAVAAQYQLTTVAVILGLGGGLIGAAAVILYRRLQHS